jgi:hypothetical protein
MTNLIAPGWRTEMVLFMLAGLILLSGCSPFSDKAQVFDAAGKPVGPLLRSDIATTPIVRFRTVDDTAAFRVWQAGLLADGMLYYESAECSGLPFLDELSTVRPGHISTVLSATAIGAPGRTVYVADAYGWTRSIRVGSFSLNEKCYFTSPSPFDKRVVPARPVADLNVQFTPPFTIQSGGS